MKPLWIQQWTQYEKNLGKFPDGISIHNTKEDAQQFVFNYNKLDVDVNNFYSFANGDPFLVLVNDDLIHVTGLGTWESDEWLFDNKKQGKIIIK